MDYYKKYLKYKQKYLYLKGGIIIKRPEPSIVDQNHDNPIPKPIPRTNTFVFISDDNSMTLQNKSPIYRLTDSELKHTFVKSKLYDELTKRNYDELYFMNLVSDPYKKSDATFVFLLDQLTYPKTPEDIFKYQIQFPKAQYINKLYSEFLNDITFKHNIQKLFISLEEYFAESFMIIKTSLTVNYLKKKLKKLTLSNYKILKVPKSHSGIGTQIFKYDQSKDPEYTKLATEIFKYVNENDKLELKDDNIEINFNYFTIENYIPTIKIAGRNFYMRVYILIVKLKTDVKVYMSTKHRLYISKTTEMDGECNNEDPLKNKRIQDCIDYEQGAHLQGGTDSNTYETNQKKEKIMIEYNLDENPNYPDNIKEAGFNKDDITNIDKQLYTIMSTIFNTRKMKEIKVDRNVQNGFQIFAADFSFIENTKGNKQLLFHEINHRTKYNSFVPYMEDLFKILFKEDTCSLKYLKEIK